MYCEVTGLTWPTGFCDPGYLCISAAETAAPQDGTNEPCPVGHYCEEGKFHLKIQTGLQMVYDHTGIVHYCSGGVESVVCPVTSSVAACNKEV